MLPQGQGHHTIDSLEDRERTETGSARQSSWKGRERQRDDDVGQISAGVGLTLGTKRDKEKIR